MVDTLAVDGWAVTFGAARRGWAGCGPAQALAIPKQPTHQRPAYQLHIIRSGTMTTSEF